MTRRKLFHFAAGGVLAPFLPAGGRQTAGKDRTPLDILPGAGKSQKLKVVFVGAHVDDWIFCAGTLARYAREGHAVLCLTFTPGDSQDMADETHLSLDALSARRREDAMRGMKIIGSHYKVLNQHNQKMHVDPDAYDDFNATLSAEKPDVVIGMWPLQFHPDHRAAGQLALNAWLASGMKFTFLFSEAQEAGEMMVQTFVPNRFVDIESVIDLKRDSTVANTFIKGTWPENERWTMFRGGEYGCRYAEAFFELYTVGSIAPENLAPRRWSCCGLKINHD